MLAGVESAAHAAPPFLPMILLVLLAFCNSISVGIESKGLASIVVVVVGGALPLLLCVQL